MNDKQRRQFERGSRIDSFMESGTADFPSGSKGGEVHALLKTELANLATLDVAKATSMNTRQQGSAGRRDVRERLRAQIAAVCDTADIISLDHPEVKGRFPRTRTDRSDQTLIAVARSFATAATPLKALFIEYNLSADFIERMNADADSLEQHISRQTEGMGARVTTNASIEETLGRADELIDRLDIIVRNKYRNEPAKLAAWESARRLERAPKTKREGVSSPPKQ
jgi:hypothetical protein